jgi:hypothetical protein
MNNREKHEAANSRRPHGVSLLTRLDAHELRSNGRFAAGFFSKRRARRGFFTLAALLLLTPPVRPTGDFEIASGVDFEVTAAMPDADLDLNLAEPGRDFELANGRLEFAPGQTTAVFSVVLHSDGLRDGDKALWVRLSKPSPGVPIRIAEWMIRVADAQSGLAQVDERALLFHAVASHSHRAAGEWRRFDPN